MKVFNILFIMVLIVADVALHNYTNIVFPLLMTFYILVNEFYDTKNKNENNKMIRRIVSLLFVLAIIIVNITIADNFSFWNIIFFIIYSCVIVAIDWNSKKK